MYFSKPQKEQKVFERLEQLNNPQLTDIMGKGDRRTKRGKDRFRFLRKRTR